MQHRERNDLDIIDQVRRETEKQTVGKMVRLDCKREVVPFTAMAAIECINVSLNTLYKAASVKGLSYFVFVTYSYAFGALVLLPLLFIFPRTGLPPLKLPIIYRIILLSLIGYGGNICAFKGIEYSSPTLASAISNLPPAFTFILAVVFRMEKLDFRSSRTKAKTIGTILSVSGALIAILFNGPVILSSSSSPSSLSLQYPEQTPQENWVLGGLLLAAMCILVSVWYILQTHVIKLYPSELTVVVLFSLCTSIIAATVCFIVETDTSAWSLRTDLALVTIVVFAFFGPSFSAAVHTWGLHVKGPVYVAIFRPISIVIAAALGVLFLGDVLHLGSVIGATILLLGFYAVIWGKANEEIMSKDSSSESPGASSDRDHLLRA